MKKSRIIVPGMAVIAFSTAAAIAGSVAWFTASRTVTISAGSYAVVKTTSNLDIELSAGVGTSVDNETDTVSFSGLLTDGSFNHIEGNIYTPNASGDAIAKETALSANNLARELTRVEDLGGKVVYTAATFDIEFSMNFGATWQTAKDVGLYLDCREAKSAFTVDGGDAAVTATGFRMGFYSTDTNGQKRVFADLQSESSCKYVASTSNFTGTAYSGDLIDSSYAAALPTSETTRAAATSRPDFLGFFEPGEDAVTLTFTVVCWFEGTDPNIVDQTEADYYQTVISNLVFEAVDLNAA